MSSILFSFPSISLLIFFSTISLYWHQSLAEISPNSRHHLEVESIGGIPQFDSSPPEFGNVEEKVGESTLRIRARRHFEERGWTGRQIIEAILCVFIPPLAVFIHGGHDMFLHVIINIVLWICGWVPGAIHAFWYCFYH